MQCRSVMAGHSMAEDHSMAGHSMTNRAGAALAGDTKPACLDSLLKLAPCVMRERMPGRWRSKPASQGEDASSPASLGEDASSPTRHRHTCTVPLGRRVQSDHRGASTLLSSCVPLGPVSRVITEGRPHCYPLVSLWAPCPE
jgi:hypothetical protein